ncbi:OsmC family protein [Oceanicoccus sp. KOV_DT_Chl]|uniref:OsmC family protein n=1 Tax=Oceanicoccus sp. KOV_DT_Chl TaxID=1904639 RepID=UPI000C7C4521|nr:OsmC family protein [Oceanicoccus sp. KOV_DT_Chl]
METLNRYMQDLSRTNFVTASCDASMNTRQMPLTDSYRVNPKLAQITDYACTRSDNIDASSPLYGEVRLTHNNPYPLAVGVHTAVGGESDYPTPGDILCGALAACLDSTIRIIANKLSVELLDLSVSVTAEIDVRGTLRVDDDVPVGFQNIAIHTDIKTAAGVDKNLMVQLLKAAEYSCVIVQTLRNAPDIAITSDLRCEDAAAA